MRPMRRPLPLARLALLLAVLLVWADGAASGGAPRVAAVGAIGMTVADADRSAEFYSRAAQAFTAADPGFSAFLHTLADEEQEHLALLSRLDDTAPPLMQPPAAFEQQRIVGDLLRERMLKGILRLGKGGLLVDELRRLQVRKEALQLVFGLLHHSRQQAQGKLFADHRQGLQQVFFV